MAEPSATSGVLVHIDYLRDQIAAVGKKVDSMADNMATQRDMTEIRQTVALMATRAEVDAKLSALETGFTAEIKSINAAVESVSAKIKDQTMESRMATLAAWAQRILAIFGLLGGLWLFISNATEFFRAVRPAAGVPPSVQAKP